MRSRGSLTAVAPFGISRESPPLFPLFPSTDVKCLVKRRMKRGSKQTARNLPELSAAMRWNYAPYGEKSRRNERALASARWDKRCCLQRLRLYSCTRSRKRYYALERLERRYKNSICISCHWLGSDSALPIYFSGAELRSTSKADDDDLQNSAVAAVTV